MLEVENRIESIAAGFRAAQVLLTANRLGIFECIEKKIRTVDALAEELQADSRGIRILLDALCALEILQKTKNGYCNTDLARRHLVAGAPEPKNSILLHNAGLYERWGKLYDVVRSGKPSAREVMSPDLSGDEVRFAQAMENAALPVARIAVERLPLPGARSLLDIGGGPGVYACEFAARNPRMRVTIMDNEKTVAYARERIQAFEVRDRIDYRIGDALTDDLGGPYDCIFLSNVIHSYSPAENLLLVSRCAGSLSSGGCVVLKDFFLDSDRTAPAWTTLFAINMLVHTASGDCYTEDEARGWLTQAGLDPQPQIIVDPFSRMVVGAKAAG